jgi:hypothetical protein
MCWYLAKEFQGNHLVRSCTVSSTLLLDEYRMQNKNTINLSRDSVSRKLFLAVDLSDDAVLEETVTNESHRASKSVFANTGYLMYNGLPFASLHGTFEIGFNKPLTVL